MNNKRKVELLRDMLWQLYAKNEASLEGIPTWHMIWKEVKELIDKTSA